MKKTTLKLDFDQIYDGYSKSVENGTRLFDAGRKLTDGFHEIAIGLFELGQEEIGKSLSFLSCFHLLSNEIDWNWFWSSWKDHQVKAHRAFIYELFSPLRITIELKDGTLLSGQSKKAKISHEKEAAFYVEYNNETKYFSTPKDNITVQEVANRGGTLFCLALTAQAIKAILDQGDLRNNYLIFSEIAFRICSENIYQEDMPLILEELSSRSSYHLELVKNVIDGMARCKESIVDIMQLNKREG